jgi:hypothetical protein
MGKGGASGKDGITIAEGRNKTFDHVSVSWGRDETFSISGSDVGNITIQNSIIGQDLQTHSCGGLMQTNVGNGISLLRNLYNDNKTRNPKVKGTNDFTNNVVYNWAAEVDTSLATAQQQAKPTSWATTSFPALAHRLRHSRAPTRTSRATWKRTSTTRIVTAR